MGDFLSFNVLLFGCLLMVVSGTSTEQRAVSLCRLDLSEELYCGKCNVNVLVNEVMP